MGDLRDFGYDFTTLARVLGVDIKNSLASLIVKTREGEYRRVHLSTGAVVKLSPKMGSKEAEKVRVVRLANGDKS